MHSNRLDPVNKKCRYSNILTYKDNKVGLSNGNYINASWVHLPSTKYFICTQGPLSKTVEDFWTMIFEYNVNVIVMLCNVEENGIEKCFNYWEINPQIIPGLKYEIKVEEKKINQFLILRDFDITDLKNGNNKKVKQVHFIGWPDHGIPDINEVFDIFVDMIEKVRQFKGTTPAVVHCSAGVGRTGTFVTLFNLYDNIMNQLKNKDNSINNEIKFSIFGTVRKMKEMRRYLVENVNQYYFIYLFVQKLLERNNN